MNKPAYTTAIQPSQYLPAIMLGGLLLTGCQTNSPTPESRLSVDAPEQWTAPGIGEQYTDDRPTPASDPSQPESWITAFGDTALNELTTEALANNYDLQAAAQRVISAYYGVKIAGAESLPQIGASGGVSRVGRSTSSGTAAVVGGNRSQFIESWDIGLALDWELDVWGRIRAGKRAAAADFNATAAEAEAFRQSLQGQVAQGYFRAVAAKEQLSLAEQTAKSFADNAAVIEGRFERGLAEALDFRLVQANASNAQAAVHVRQQEYDTAIRQLEVLLGRYPAAVAETAISLKPIDAAVPAAVPAQLLSQRWDIQVAGQQLTGSDYRVAEARKSMLPSFSLTAGGGYDADEFEQFFESPFRIWNLAGNLSQPIFQGGRLKANAKRQEANREIALANYQQTVLDAFREVESALAAEQFLADQEAAVAAAYQQSKAAESIALERYRAGLVDIITLLEAQRRAFSAGSDLIDARLARLQNRVALHLAIGGDSLQTAMPEKGISKPQEADDNV